MNLKTIQKTRFALVIMGALMFAACGEKKQDAGSEGHEQHAQEQAAETPEPTGEVVKTPDYKAGNAPVKASLEQLLSDYLKVNEALTASDLAAAKKQAGAVAAAAQKVPVASLAGAQQAFAAEKLEEISRSAGKMAAAGKIEQVRENLELLSEATFSLTKAFGVTDQKLYYQHCPMANDNEGGYWLSASKEIRNPYFGEAMLECGSTEEVLN
jgi:hypothetical protein